ncbi:MAG: hypothetical protein Q9165_002494 [Trypethelium subeluteriae]
MASPQNEEKSIQQASPSAQSSASRPSLLPAFEPLPSSPALPTSKSVKRKFDDRNADTKHYPTPIPTSSTGILPSSPPAVRPGLNRTVSTISTLEERAPLGTVPTVDVPLSGEPVNIGRSANSSDYQLSANRLISRVHIRAMYLAPSSEHTFGEILIKCLGWNGAKIHCRNEIYQLGKGDTFLSDRPEAQIIADVLETRVVIAWPRKDSEDRSGTGWEEEEETLTRNAAEAVAQQDFASSPPLMPGRLQSPVSPSPLRPANLTASATFLASDPPDASADGIIQVYEDHDSADDQQHSPSQRCGTPQQSSRTLSERSPLKLSKSNPSRDFEEHSDSNEENDPIIHSFYTSGENLLSRFESIRSDAATTPDRSHPRLMLCNSSTSPQQGASSGPTRKVQVSPIKNHVINQLAYSRIHSMPLSTIFNNLPSDLKNAASPSKSSGGTKLTGSELKAILDTTPCVGEINREGKDAAGKPLENEFYYVPEMDVDDMRRNTVVEGLGKPGLRAVRKQHKSELRGKLLKEQERRSEEASRKDLLSTAVGSSDEDEDSNEDGEPLWLVLTTKKFIVDKTRLKPGKMEILQHPSFPASLSQRITQIIPIAKLRTNYKSFESRRQLVAQYDLFLADDRIITYLPSLLGKTFYKSGPKRPIPISLAPKPERVDGKRVKNNKKHALTPRIAPKDRGPAQVATPTDAAREIEKALTATTVQLSPSTSTSVRIARSGKGWTPEMVKRNVEVAVEQLVEKWVPGKWRGVRALYVKGEKTASLPIWMADQLWEGEEDVLEESKQAEKKSRGDGQGGEEAAGGEVKALTRGEGREQNKKRKTDGAEHKEGKRRKKKKANETDDGSEVVTRKRKLEQKKKAVMAEIEA